MKFESKSGWNLLQPVKRRALDKSRKRTLAYSAQTKISMMRYQVFYLHSCLEFDLSPIYQPVKIWTTVYFKHRHHQQKINDNIDDTQVMWILQSLADARSRNFHHLPFHKIDDVVVNLFAPDPRMQANFLALAEDH
jgi:trans-aconitate methyltransferase